MGKKKRKVYPLEIHHRLPQCMGKDHSERNTSVVKSNLHSAYHALFGHGGDVENTARILNDTWIRSDYMLIVVKR